MRGGLESYGEVVDGIATKLASLVKLYKTPSSKVEEGLWVGVSGDEDGGVTLAVPSRGAPTPTG